MPVAHILKYPHLMLITSLPIPTSHLCYQVSELTPIGQHASRDTTPASRRLIETIQHWPSCPTQDTRPHDPMITPAALLPNRHFQLIHELALRLQPLICVTIRSCRVYSRKHLGNTVHRLHTCYPELGPHKAGNHITICTHDRFWRWGACHFSHLELLFGRVFDAPRTLRWSAAQTHQTLRDAPLFAPSRLLESYT